MVVTSKEFWMGLPDDIRPVIKKSLDEAIALGNKVASEKSVSDKKKITESGRSEVITLTDAERNLWVEAMKPVWKQFEGQIGKELIDAAYNSNK